MRKKNINQIYEYDIYYVNIEPIMKNRNITKNSLSRMTGIAYNTLQRYCKSEIQRVDLDIISKICSALKCDINDIIVKD